MATNNSQPCKNCGATELANGRLNIVDSTLTPKLKVAVDQKPGKLLSAPINSSITVRICSGCGLIELYADEAEKLYAAFLESQAALASNLKTKQN